MVIEEMTGQRNVEERYDCARLDRETPHAQHLGLHSALDRRSDTRILGMALLDEIRQDYAK
jgi:hypothetical protein